MGAFSPAFSGVSLGSVVLPLVLILESWKAGLEVSELCFRGRKVLKAGS